MRVSVITGVSLDATVLLSRYRVARKFAAALALCIAPALLACPSKESIDALRSLGDTPTTSAVPAQLANGTTTATSVVNAVATGEVSNQPPRAEGGTQAAITSDGTNGVSDTGTVNDSKQANDSNQANHSQATGTGTGPVALDGPGLLRLMKSQKLSDANAQKALDQARAANLPVHDLAVAANARGESLLATPERATGFFEWASRVDPVYPDATFNLAKLAANAGELDTCKTLIKEVKARGGKKLLKKVEFDPVFNALNDDPEFRALLK